MNFFRNLFHRQPKTAQQQPAVTHRKIDTQQLQALAVVFEALDRFKRGNLLYVDFKRRSVTISAALAELFIYDDQEWQNFLHNLHLWTICQYNISDYTRNYTKAMANAEAEAFRSKNQQTPDANRQPLTDAERKLARMRAAARFDDEQRDRRSTIPDLQFVVIGAADGEPLVVARLLDGRYETLPVPDQPTVDSAADDDA